jgi:hypothetical protein
LSEKRPARARLARRGQRRGNRSARKDTITAQTNAHQAVSELSARLDHAEQLLQEFIDRFSWLTEHADYLERVRAFLQPAAG